jgi:hypothetical protein
MDPAPESPSFAGGLLLPLVFVLLVAIGLVFIFILPPSEDPLPETIIKTITVKDMVVLDGREFVYSTDREIFTTRNIFLFRELTVNQTYIVEYKPFDPEGAMNVYHINGQILDIKEAVPDA